MLRAERSRETSFGVQVPSQRGVLILHASGLRSHLTDACLVCSAAPWRCSVSRELCPRNHYIREKVRCAARAGQGVRDAAGGAALRFCLLSWLGRGMVTPPAHVAAGKVAQCSPCSVASHTSALTVSLATSSLTLIGGTARRARRYTVREHGCDDHGHDGQRTGDRLPAPAIYDRDALFAARPLFSTMSPGHVL